MKFNALLLIDLWHEPWAQAMCIPDYHIFVADVLEYVAAFKFDHVLYSSGDTPVHPGLLAVFPAAVGVRSVQQAQQLLEPDSSILVGGAAWHACLHHGPVNFGNLASEGQFTVYSAPHICAHYYTRRDAVLHQDFESDRLLNWVRVFDYWRLNPGAGFDQGRG